MHILVSRLGLVVRRSVGKRKNAGSVSRLGLVVPALAWSAKGRRFDSPLRLTFLFKNCDFWTLSRDFVLHN